MPSAVTLPPWLLALLALGSAVGLWKFMAGLVRSGAHADLRKVLEQDFFTVTDGDGLGKRLKAVEVNMAAQEGRIAALERVDETHNFQVSALAERQGRLEGRQDKTETLLEETLRKVEGRLGNIEGQLEIIVKRKGSA